MIHPKEAQSAEAVARHYDELDPFYREIWGNHVHHGYWATGTETPMEAVEALVDHLAERLTLQPGQRVCDVGCGYGAAALRLANRFGVHVSGLTISPVQAAHAQTNAVGNTSVEIGLGDWLNNTFCDAAFDSVYAIESSEHMEDKARFFSEAFRTLRPGGRLGIYAWLARERPRHWEVKYLLEPICREGRLPSLGTESDYRALATEAGFRVVSFEDISQHVRRTWTVCAYRLAGKLLTRPEYRRFISDQKAENRVFALSLVRLLLAYRTRSMRYCLLIASKPSGLALESL
jgi:tocopherol O-methyltransferase